jgi:hypothetical protein
LVLLGFICHFLASSWVFIGKYLQYNYNTGWIIRLKEYSSLDYDYDSEYIASIYFIFTTLSTVGYGDVVGTESVEYLFQSFLLVNFS